MSRNPYDVQRIFEEMALGLIASLKRNFQRHRDWETREGFRWDRWQLVKLRNLASFRGGNSKIIRRAFKEAEKLTDDVLQDSFSNGENRFIRTIRRLFGTEQRAAYEIAGELGLPIDERPPPLPRGQKRPQLKYEQLPRAQTETRFFGMNEKKLEALQESVHNDLR